MTNEHDVGKAHDPPTLWGRNHYFFFQICYVHDDQTTRGFSQILAINEIWKKLINCPSILLATY
jgi:hypothetical protein